MEQRVLHLLQFLLQVKLTLLSLKLSAILLLPLHLLGPLLRPSQRFLFLQTNGLLLSLLLSLKLAKPQLLLPMEFLLFCMPTRDFLPLQFLPLHLLSLQLLSHQLQSLQLLPLSFQLFVRQLLLLQHSLSLLLVLPLLLYLQLFGHLLRLRLRRWWWSSDSSRRDTPDRIDNHRFSTEDISPDSVRILYLFPNERLERVQLGKKAWMHPSKSWVIRVHLLRTTILRRRRNI
jgi:hypothetical protein